MVKSGLDVGGTVPIRSATIIDESNIAKVEEDTLQLVDRTLVVLSDAVGAWNKSKDKPPKLLSNFSKYKRLYEHLKEWKTKMIENKNAAFEKKAATLREFVEICYIYG